MLLLALMGANGLFAILESDGSIHIPKMYYQVCSVALAALPVAWTKFLDSMKEYEDSLTPNTSMDNSPPNSINANTDNVIEMGRPSSAPH